MNAWKDISTAPKDGTPILVCVSGCWPDTVAWNAKQEAWEEGDGSFSTLDDWPLTHWMPLPEPPEKV